MAHGPGEELGVHVRRFLRGRVPWRCVHSLSAEVQVQEQDELLDELLDAKSGIDAARKSQFRIFKL